MVLNAVNPKSFYRACCFKIWSQKGKRLFCVLKASSANFVPPSHSWMTHWLPSQPSRSTTEMGRHCFVCLQRAYSVLHEIHTCFISCMEGRVDLLVAFVFCLSPTQNTFFPHILFFVILCFCSLWLSQAQNAQESWSDRSAEMTRYSSCVISFVTGERKGGIPRKTHQQDSIQITSSPCIVSSK